MKKEFMAILFFLCCHLGFSFTLTCGRAADEICIGAHQYFLANKKMPESVDELNDEIYIHNASNKFASFDQNGYKYKLKKLSETKIEITVRSKNLKIKITYEKGSEHKFMEFYNDEVFASHVYYRDEHGNIYQ